MKVTSDSEIESIWFDQEKKSGTVTPFIVEQDSPQKILPHP